MKLQDGAKTVYNRANGLPEDQVRCLYADPQGQSLGRDETAGAWPSPGLAPPQWFNPGSLVEPFSDLITAIVEDQGRRLCGSARPGIFWVLKKKRDLAHPAGWR